jgi:hypothetical protein
MNTNLIVKLPPLIRELAIRRSWFEERDGLLAKASSFNRISSRESFETAGATLSAISRSIEIVDAMRMKLAAPFLQAAKTIKAAADSAKAPLEEARATLRAKLSVYADKERGRKETARLRALAVRESAVEEYGRVQLLSVERFGSQTTLFNPPLPPEPPKRPAPFPKAESVAVRANLRFEIADESQVPREFLSPDKSKIREWLNLNREDLRERLRENPSASPLPGIVFKLETEVVPR